MICPPELTERGVTLTNSRGVFDTPPIAEWVLAAVLSHVKGIADTLALQRTGRWQYRTTGRLAGKRAAVVGTGSIGRTIADRLSRLDVRATLIGRRESGDLAAVAAEVDILIAAVPLTPATTIDRCAGARRARPGRGSSQRRPRTYGGRGGPRRSCGWARSRGAALDVFEVEPPLPADSPLWSMPHVLVSPHMSGGDYVGFEVDMMGVFVDNLRRWLRGERLHNIVDPALGYVRN